MAWEFDGGFLAPGTSITWAYWWGGDPHEYKGIQVVQARPERLGSIVILAGRPRLTVSNPALQLEDDRGYTYFVTITNSSDATFYQYTVRGQRID
ncbi:MAG: cytochrome P450 [Acidobacteria bacterium]|nr:cytochrome P450 [Acidobacteriota bacterium]